MERGGIGEGRIILLIRVCIMSVTIVKADAHGDSAAFPTIYHLKRLSLRQFAPDLGFIKITLYKI